METEKVQKVPTKFSCDLCDYFSSRRSQYERHLNTSKHLKMSNFNQMEPKSSSEYICSNCDKVYKDRSGLWKHHKTCIEEKNPENIDHTDEYGVYADDCEAMGGRGEITENEKNIIKKIAKTVLIEKVL